MHHEGVAEESRTRSLRRDTTFNFGEIYALDRQASIGQASNANTDLAIENWLNFRVAMFLE